MTLKEKLKAFGTKAKEFVARNWKPILVGTITVGGVAWCIVCRKKLKDKFKWEKLDIKDFSIGEPVVAYEFKEFTEVATNYVPIKDLGKLGEEAMAKIPNVTEDTLACVDVNFLKWRPEGK